MNFNVGDQVCFLNEKRDGVVSKIISKEVVNVTIDDGFEIPVSVKDLIKKMDFSKAINENVKMAEIPEVNESISSISPGKSLTPGLYIAYMLDKNAANFNGNLSVYLVNHTSFECVFTISRKENGNFIFCDYDRVDEESKYLLQNIGMTELDQWSGLYVEALFYKAGSSKRRDLVSAEVGIKPLKFYKDESYKDIEGFEGKCILIPVDPRLKQQEWDDAQWKNEKLELSKGMSVLPQETPMSNFPENMIIEPGIGEIDLHIQNLTDKHQRMDHNEMLTFQISYFIKHLESAIHSKLQKLIVIHGVGNGVLKAEVKKVLLNYEGIESSDAAILKYGVGATEIRIPAGY